MELNPTKFTINQHTFFLSPDQPIYFISIYTGSKSNFFEIPQKHDVTAISLKKIPEGLEAIEIYIGEQKIFEIDNLQPDINLLDNILPLSKSYYMVTKLGFRFNKEYLDNNIKFEWIYETKDVEDISDTEIEIYDGLNYHKGNIVHRKRITTGNKIKHFIKFAIELPDLTIHTVESTKDSKESYVMPIWQKIKVFPNDNKTYLDKCVKNYGLQTINGLSIDEAITKTEPFICKIKNHLRFQEGMAGITHCHGFYNI